MTLKKEILVRQEKTKRILTGKTRRNDVHKFSSQTRLKNLSYKRNFVLGMRTKEGHIRETPRDHPARGGGCKAVMRTTNNHCLLPTYRTCVQSYRHLL